MLACYIQANRCQSQHANHTHISVYQRGSRSSRRQSRKKSSVVRYIALSFKLSDLDIPVKVCRNQLTSVGVSMSFTVSSATARWRQAKSPGGLEHALSYYHICCTTSSNSQLLIDFDWTTSARACVRTKIKPSSPVQFELARPAPPRPRLDAIRGPSLATAKVTN